VAQYGKFEWRSTWQVIGKGLRLPMISKFNGGFGFGSFWQHRWQGSSISERVKRLEEAGIIEGYCVTINPRALGLGLMAIVRLRTTHEHIKTCLRKFGEIPNIVEVHRVTGEDCFVLKVLVPTPEDLETIVDRIAGFGAVTTSLVLRSEPARAIGRELIRRHFE
jgi:Lrp/AsnC family transcriptional regulator, leucine-responsive regulatory protein